MWVKKKHSKKSHRRLTPAEIVQWLILVEAVIELLKVLIE